MIDSPSDFPKIDADSLRVSSATEMGGDEDGAPSSLLSQVGTLRQQVNTLQNQAKELKKTVVSKRAEFESLNGELRAVRKKKTHATLILMRERDTALERVQILERQLTLFREEAGLPTARARKHAHFLERLDARCGLKLTLEDLSALESLARERPALHFTRRGTPVKALSVHGQWIYALMTPDEEGRPTLTTVYTADMLEVRDFFQTTARPQKIR